MKRLLTVAVILLTMSAVSSAQIALKGIGGAIGFSSVSFGGGGSSESMSGFLIAAHADLGEFTKDFAFFPSIEYFSTSKDISGSTWKVSDFAINADVHYNIAMEGMLKPYVGAGLGYNSLSFTWSVPAFFGFGGTYTGSDSRLGINLLAGFNYKLNDMLTLLVEPRYVLASDYNHFIIKAGVTYALKP
ncbi:MAG TPA: outer membrane beta-barrel protein [Bacteroidota bacterium]